MHSAESLEQERAALQQQVTEIASLAGGLAHEIRNPLSTMSLNLDLMAEDLSAGESSRDKRLLKKIGTLRRECEHLERILEDFLQFARVGTLQTQVLNLNDTILEFIESFRPVAAEQQIELSPHLAADLPLVRVDAGLWRQLLVNLSRNAGQAMPNGGVLELQTRQEDGCVVLEIIDTGHGMSAATQQRMFETFYSTRDGGSGLGLPTVRKIVAAHGGTMTCESEEGRGTRFSIRLPIALEAELPMAADRAAVQA